MAKHRKTGMLFSIKIIKKYGQITKNNQSIN